MASGAEVGVVFSILNSILDRLNNWRWRRYPPVVLTVSLRNETAVANAATFDHPVFLKSIKFELLGKKEETVSVNKMLAPHSQFDCPAPRHVIRDLVLVNDLAITAAYKTETGRSAQTDSPIFSLVGGDGRIAKIEESGKYLGWGKCPKCGDDWMFSTSGVANMKELSKRRRAFEKDMKKTCPNHDESRKRFWRD